METATVIKPFGKIPQVLTIDRFARDNNFLESLMAPIMLSAKLRQQIKDLPKEAFGHTEGRKIFYTLFTMLNMVDEYRKQNHRWDEEEEKALQSTKRMMELMREDLQKELKIEIPLNSIFNKEDGLDLIKDVNA